MVVVDVTGGLGNQMFQFALYYQLKHNGRRVRLNYSYLFFDERFKNRGDVIDCFCLDFNRPCKKIRNFLSKAYVYRIEPHLSRRLQVYRESITGTYDDTVFSKDNCILRGYWQSELYFKAVRNELRKCFKPKHQIPDRFLPVLDEIRSSSCPVSIHIRLGDYTEGVNKEIYGNICTTDYYFHAIQLIKERYPDCTFFVFTNQVDGVTAILNEEINNNRFVIINNDKEKDAWVDMYLMSQCKHNIIANSSFSWWGAWLNNNQERMVIAPKRWKNGSEMPDICPAEWIRI